MADKIYILQYLWNRKKYKMLYYECSESTVIYSALVRVYLLWLRCDFVPLAFQPFLSKQNKVPKIISQELKSWKNNSSTIHFLYTSTKQNKVVKIQFKDYYHGKHSSIIHSFCHLGGLDLAYLPVNSPWQSFCQELGHLVLFVLSSFFKVWAL